MIRRIASQLDRTGERVPKFRNDMQRRGAGRAAQSATQGALSWRNADQTIGARVCLAPIITDTDSESGPGAVSKLGLKSTISPKNCWLCEYC
ncbi:hypothetical protein ACJ73_03815 [Blastomyces percursus]|uniref:Uncharacterized protein n=1 Tax=Blastomyces percursus TaxID=1658174 RepID=A0A1J9R8K1_9EURO|nr:hypothetical protein ACJ73_03815 [Blastomyces percursus]